MFVLQNSVPRRIFGLRGGKNTTAMKPLLSFLTLTQTFRATGFTSPKDKRKSQTWMHFCRPIFTWVFMHVFNTVSVYICACLYNRGASDITRASPRIIECLFYLILSLLHLITYLCPFLLLLTYYSISLWMCVSLSSFLLLTHLVSEGNDLLPGEQSALCEATLRGNFWKAHQQRSYSEVQQGRERNRVWRQVRRK